MEERKMVQAIMVGASTFNNCWQEWKECWKWRPPKDACIKVYLLDFGVQANAYKMRASDERNME
jgi:hypothetical protein